MHSDHKSVFASFEKSCQINAESDKYYPDFQWMVGMLKLKSKCPSSLINVTDKILPKKIMSQL